MLIYDKRFDRHIDYGPIFNGPGLIGHVGEGYWWHAPWRLMGFTLKGLGRVYKTITADPRAGNMKLDKKTLRPVEWYPKCLKVYPNRKAIVNAVGLANPGTLVIMERGVYQQETQPFMISFMATGATRAERVESARKFVRIMRHYVRHIGVPFVLQVNFGCPNTHVDPAELYDEIMEIIMTLTELGVPMILNFNGFVPVPVLVRAEPYVAGYWIANTVPWGSTGAIDWTRYEADGHSPLPLRLGDVDFWGRPEVQEEQYRQSQNKGGLSSHECLQLTLDKVRQAREAGVEVPIIAGNGIQSARDVRRAYNAGASGVAIVTVAMVAPWRMRGIIREARSIDVRWRESYSVRKRYSLAIQLQQ